MAVVSAAESVAARAAAAAAAVAAAVAAAAAAAAAAPPTRYGHHCAQRDLTWVDFPGSACGNGVATGVGVNLHQSTDVLIYLQGGGAVGTTRRAS